MRRAPIFLFILIGCLQLPRATAYNWSNDDFEIFDLVEEIDKNFYELMQIKQVIIWTDIKLRFD